MTTPQPPPGYFTNRLSLQPVRSYDSRGGPFAANLGKTTVKKLAEIQRGDVEDRGTGSKR